MAIRIEEFSVVTEDRAYEMSLMKSKDRRTMEMHIGGIVIETLIKYMIIKYYDIHERNGIRDWIPRRNIHNNSNNIKNPSHNLIQGIRRLPFLMNKVDTNIRSSIQIIQSPNNIEYIDLRYYTGTIPDDKYQEWKVAFNAVRKWLKKNIDTF